MSQFKLENGVIKEYYGNSEHVVIPDGSTKIGDSVFYDKKIKSVQISKTIKVIGSGAFAYNDLESINIPYGVLVIEDGAFYKNNLKEVIIPDTVTKLENNAFAQNNIKHFTISTKTLNIGFNIFTELETLTIVNKGNLINFLEEWRGKINFSLIKNIEITGNSLTLNEKQYLNGCNIKYEEKENNSIEDFVVKNGVLLEYNGTSEYVEIPNFVEEIGYRAFADKNLTSVKIPVSVTRIDIGAFAENNLKEILIPYGVLVIEDGAFYDNTLEEVVISESVTTIKNSAFGNNKKASVLKHFTIPTTVKSIGYNIFHELEILTIVNKGNLINFLEEWSGKINFSLIKNIEITGNSLTLKEKNYINDKLNKWNIRYEGKDKNKKLAFVGDYVVKDGVLIGYNGTCENVAIPEFDFDPGISSYFSLPRPVTIIGIKAFYAKKIRSVIIPDTITVIEEFAFANNNLTDVNIPSSVKKIGGRAFIHNNLSNFTIPTTVEEVGAHILGDNLVKFTIVNRGNLLKFLLMLEQTYNLKKGYNIEIVGKQVTKKEKEIIKRNYINNKFAYKTREGEQEIDDINPIDDFVIEDGVLIKYIGKSRNVVIPSHVEKIKDGAFLSCNLTNVIIPNSVKEIDDFAFAGNNLTNVIIPSSVEKIGKFAFNNNPLTKLTILADNIDIHYKAFNRINLEELTLKSSINIKSFSWPFIASTNYLNIIIDAPFMEFIPKLKRIIRCKKLLKTVSSYNQRIVLFEIEKLKRIFKYALLYNGFMGVYPEIPDVLTITKKEETNDDEINEVLSKIKDLTSLLDKKLETEINEEIEELLANYNRDLINNKPKLFKEESNVFNKIDSKTLKENLISALEKILGILKSKYLITGFLLELSKYIKLLNQNITMPSSIDSLEDKIKYIIITLKKYNLIKVLEDIFSSYQKQAQSRLNNDFSNKLTLNPDVEIDLRFKLEIDRLFIQVENYEKLVSTMSGEEDNLLARNFKTLLTIIDSLDLENKNRYLKLLEDLKLKYNFDYLKDKELEAVYYDIRVSLESILEDLKNVVPFVVESRNIINDLNIGIAILNNNESDIVLPISGIVIEIINLIDNFTQEEKEEVYNKMMILLNSWKERLSVEKLSDICGELKKENSYYNNLSDTDIITLRIFEELYEIKYDILEYIKDLNNYEASVKK